MIIVGAGVTMLFVFGIFLSPLFISIDNPEERKIQMIQKMAELEGFRVIHSKGIHGNYELTSITGTDTWFHLVFEDTEDELQIKMELVYFETYNSWNLHTFSQVPI